MAKGTCKDCGKEIDPIQYVRRATVKESHAMDLGMHVERDKLCKPCWKKDSAKAKTR